MKPIERITKIQPGVIYHVKDDLAFMTGVTVDFDDGWGISWDWGEAEMYELDGEDIEPGSSVMLREIAWYATTYIVT